MSIKTKVVNAAIASQTVNAIAAWASADSAAVGALVDVYLSVATFGAITPDAIQSARPAMPTASAKVYASNFNRAHKVASVLGADATADMIRQAASAGDGRARERIADALASAMKATKGGKKPTKAAAKKIAKEAVSFAATKATAKKSATKRAAKVAVPAEVAKPTGNVYRDTRAQLTAASLALHAHDPETERKATHAKLCKMLGDCIELAATLAK